MLSEDTERSSGSAGTGTAMRNTNGGGCSAQAVGWVGQGEECRPEEKADWSNYYLDKLQFWESQYQGVTPKSSWQKGWSNMLGWSEKAAQMTAGRGRDDWKNYCFAVQAGGREILKNL